MTRRERKQAQAAARGSCQRFSFGATAYGHGGTRVNGDGHTCLDLRLPERACCAPCRAKRALGIEDAWRHV